MALRLSEGLGNARTMLASAAVPGLPVAAGALQTDAPPTDALPADAQEIANDVIGLFNKLKRK